MEIVPEDVIWAEFRKKYEEKPKGWRIHSGLSPKGFPELLISGPKESWLMKRESLYSGKLGVGGRIPEGIKLNSKILRPSTLINCFGISPKNLSLVPAAGMIATKSLFTIFKYKIEKIFFC